ncbi:O-methyltransferase-domain-containing protein [Chytriomyces sp. MP71]|nr:O-methyltransferase-domain-containing protein [Chytriomyces sp. MP71]
MPKADVDFGYPVSWLWFSLSSVLATFLHHLADLLMPPPLLVVKDANGFLSASILYTVTRLEIADTLHDCSSGKSSAELAEASGCKCADTLQRILRAAETAGYFHQDVQTGLWTNSPKSSVLRKDHPNSMNALVRHWKEDCAPAMLRMYDGVRDDALPFSLAREGGQGDIWAHFEENPAQEQQFASAMDGLDSMSRRAHVADFSWGQYKRVIDYGGSHGPLLRGILETHSQVQGILFDRSPVIKNAEAEWTSKHAHVKDRVAFVPGDFFKRESIPTFQDGDAIVLRYILHDWSDDLTREILKNVRLAIGNSKASLLLLETCLQPHDPMPDRFLLDVLMHIIQHGKERYRADWETLLNETGFRLEFVNDTRSLNRIIVAKPM